MRQVIGTSWNGSLMVFDNFNGDWKSFDNFTPSESADKSTLRWGIRVAREKQYSITDIRIVKF